MLIDNRIEWIKNSHNNNLLLKIISKNVWKKFVIHPKSFLFWPQIHTNWTWHYNNNGSTNLINFTTKNIISTCLSIHNAMSISHIEFWIETYQNTTDDWQLTVHILTSFNNKFTEKSNPNNNEFVLIPNSILIVCEFLSYSIYVPEVFIPFISFATINLKS